MQKTLLGLGIGVGIAVVLVAALYFIPWSQVNWGQVAWQPARTVTVTGTATTQVSNQVAHFTAGVNAVNDDKQKAVDEVNTKIQALINSVKQFGIEEKDIKTQNINIYQMQVSEPGTQRQKLGQWGVNNTIEITLRDIKRANELTQLLSSSGANNVYGPNFSLDADSNAADGLAAQAIEEARKKAESMAKASGATLGKVLVVNEGTAVSGQPVPMLEKGMGGGGGMPTEAGSTTVSKSVTVTFELK